MKMTKKDITEVTTAGLILVAVFFAMSFGECVGKALYYLVN